MPDNGDRVLRTTVEVGDETREVEVELPDGYLTPDEIRESYVPKATIESRISRAVKGRYTIDEVVEDDGLLGQIATTAEDRLRERLQVGGEKPDLTKYEESWRQRELKPVSEELESAKGEIQTLRAARLSADVNEAAVDLGVKKSQLPLLAPFYRERVQWSDEYGDWFIVGKDGEFELGSPQRGAPYLTIGEDLERKARSGDYEDWFDGKGRTGPDYQGGKGGGRPGQVDLAAFEKMSGDEKIELFHKDRAKYDQLMAELTEKNRAKRAS